ncbi:MAG: pyridoxamine 5'-phosphate oxidase family protein [Pseudomonadales bacterium]
MSERFDELLPEHATFISKQKVFFVGSAARDGRVNVSPKGQDSLRVLGPRRILWLNLTGSGNETATHLLDCNRITLMWCAFQGPPLILRAYGSARVVHPDDAGWAECSAAIPAPVGARQFFDVSIDLVQTSCGYAVPLLEYQEDRRALTLWAEKRGTDGIAEYWRENNQLSLDGRPTDLAG